MSYMQVGDRHARIATERRCLADLIRQKARQSTASNRQAVPAN